MTEPEAFIQPTDRYPELTRALWTLLDMEMAQVRVAQLPYLTGTYIKDPGKRGDSREDILALFDRGLVHTVMNMKTTRFYHHLRESGGVAFPRRCLYVLKYYRFSRYLKGLGIDLHALFAAHLLRASGRHMGQITHCPVDDLIPESEFNAYDREILTLFDQPFTSILKGLARTDYYRLQREKRKKGVFQTLKWVRKYHRLYRKIRKNGYRQTGQGLKSYPWLYKSANGTAIRLDGHHRSAVARHLKMKTLPALVITDKDLVPFFNGAEAFEPIIGSRASLLRDLSRLIPPEPLRANGPKGEKPLPEAVPDTAADPPRVLIFSSKSRYQADCRGGGAEASLRLIAEKLAGDGWPVTYITRGNAKVPGLSRKIINGVGVYRFTPLRLPLLGSRLFPVLQGRFISWQKRQILARFIKRHRIQVVHTFNPVPDTRDILHLKTRHRLPFKTMLRVAGIHWVSQIEKGEVSRETLARVFNGVDVLNFLDPSLKTLFMENCRQYGIGISGPQEVIHDIGVDLTVFTPGPATPRTGPFTIVCGARFSTYQKRQDILIDACALIREEEINIIFAGDGDRLAACREKVRSLNLAHRIDLPGALPPGPMRDLVRSADLVVLPTDFEGVSKAVIEALAMKKPVLASDVPALNNYLENGKTALLVPNEPRAWADAICRLKKNPELRHNLAEAGHNMTMKTYDAGVNLSGYKTVFRRLAAPEGQND